MIAGVLNWIGNFFQNLFSGGLSFIANLFGYLFQGLIDFLKLLFRPVLIVIALLFYFIYKLGELIVMLFMVLLSIGKLLYSFVMGLFRTLAGFVWTPTSPNHGQWSSPIREVFTGLEPFQLDKIAYVMIFAIWIMTAWAAIRILSGRGGSSGD